MATMTLTAQEATFLALLSDLNTEARELIRTLMRDLASASRTAGGAQ
jgi:hypothetical protein